MALRFGTCELDTQTRELSRDGDRVPIEPQVFDLLHHLIENRNRVVGRDEIVHVIWRGVPVSDATIDARVHAARRAVGDSGAAQAIIRTVPRRGFRFVADVRASDTPSPSTDAQHIRFCRSADGTRLAYARSGTGPVLMRAGHWLTHLEHDWRSPLWRPVLEAFGRSHTLVRYDQRGNGLSDWELRDVSLDAFVADLACVADAAGLNRFDLYATSQAVPTALVFAARHPERVRRLILHGGFVRGRLVRGDPAEREKGEAYLALIRHGWGQEGSQFLQAFAAIFAPDATPEQTRSFVDLQRLSTTAENAERLRRAFDEFDASAVLTRVVAPTLVMHARNDGVHPFSQGIELASGISDAEFVALESRNHVLLEHDRAWQQFFATLANFLAV